MHIVVQKLEELQVGTSICFKGIGKIYAQHYLSPDNERLDEECTMRLTGINGRSLTVSYRVFSEAGEAVSGTLDIDYADYIYSEVFSPDALKMVGPEEIWGLCETHYGINHHGSQDPDPIRQLALAILKGDPIACDAARDILKV